MGYEETRNFVTLTKWQAHVLPALCVGGSSSSHASSNSNNNDNNTPGPRAFTVINYLSGDALGGRTGPRIYYADLEGPPLLSRCSGTCVVLPGYCSSASTLWD